VYGMLDSHGSARCCEDEALIALPAHVRTGSTSEVERSVDDGERAIPHGAICCLEARESQ